MPALLRLRDLGTERDGRPEDLFGPLFQGAWEEFCPFCDGFPFFGYGVVSEAVPSNSKHFRTTGNTEPPNHQHH